MYQVKDIPIHHPDYDKYPFSDGELMAETTFHARWIVKIKENLDVLTRNKDIFVAMDLLWYPVQGKVNICKAPDVMVTIGRPQGERLSYLQWHENNMPPQVVFEIYSKSNQRRNNKENLLDFYERYGVEEYYSYDPERNTFVVYIYQDNKFSRLEGLSKWISSLLQIKFEWSEAGLEIYHPDGSPFITLAESEEKVKDLEMQHQEIMELRQQERKRMLQAEKEETLARQEAAIEKLKAKNAELKADVERQKAENAELKAEAERQKNEDLLRRIEALEKQLKG